MSETDESSNNGGVLSCSWVDYPYRERATGCPQMPNAVDVTHLRVGVREALEAAAAAKELSTSSSSSSSTNVAALSNNPFAALFLDEDNDIDDNTLMIPLLPQLLSCHINLQRVQIHVRVVARIPFFLTSDCHQQIRTLELVGEDESGAPSRLVAIKNMAFEHCHGLTHVTGREHAECSLERIGIWAFGGCFSLQNLILSPLRNLRHVGYGAFEGCSSLVISDFSNAIDLLVISTRTFNHCQALKKIGLPPNLTIIGPSAFRWCFSLEECHLPKTLTEIHRQAFLHCHALERVSIPPKVRLIQSEAFGHCRALSNVTFQSGTTLGRQSFVKCPSLRTIHWPGRVPRILWPTMLARIFDTRAYSGILAGTGIQKIQQLNSIAFNFFRLNAALLFVDENRTQSRTETTAGPARTLRNLPNVGMPLNHL